MRDDRLFPLIPDPSWYERHWLLEDSVTKPPRHARIRSRSPRRVRSAALFALALFSVAAACGAGLGHFHLLAP